MRLGTLENSSVERILAAFNSAFSDYIVPLQLTVQQLQDKMPGDQVDLRLSPAAFENDQLIGFILHGYDPSKPSMAYNAGTGVVPSKRGQGVTSRLYQYILPSLAAKGIDTIQLEVITENKPALSVYEKLGFKIERTFNCYRGSMDVVSPNKNFIISELGHYDWDTLTSYWDCTPSWQNSIAAMEALKEKTVSIAAYRDQTIVGYLVYNPQSKRVLQFAVNNAWREEGAGEALFAYISSNYSKDVSMINVDSNSKFTANLLERIGLKNYISQYEMQWRFR
jgi:GNAT superfamily N-acetyltransferase